VLCGVLIDEYTIQAMEAELERVANQHRSHSPSAGGDAAVQYEDGWAPETDEEEDGEDGGTEEEGDGEEEEHDLFWPIENRKSRAVHVFTRYRYIYRQKYTNT
jgi:hypothetical protein